MMDRMIEKSKRHVTIVKNDKEEDVEVLTGYSWRNFFSGINFLKIMQKLSKGRSHRIWLLVQFKSTVSIIIIPSCLTTLVNFVSCARLC